MREGLAFAGEVGRLRGEVGKDDGERGRAGGLLTNLGDKFSNTSFSRIVSLTLCALRSVSSKFFREPEMLEYDPQKELFDLFKFPLFFEEAFELTLSGRSDINDRILLHSRAVAAATENASKVSRYESLD